MKRKRMNIFIWIRLVCLDAIAKNYRDRALKAWNNDDGAKYRYYDKKSFKYAHKARDLVWNYG
jgi:hypothetical protein